MKSRILITFIAGGVLGAVVVLLLISLFAEPVGFYLLALHTKNLEHNRSLALEDGKQTIIYVQQFIELYPNAVHNFSYYTGEYGPPTWNSEVGLYGRYILTMQLPVQFDEERKSVIEYGDPSFYLDEIKNITEEGDRLFINQSNFQLQFGEEEWDLLLRSKGDIAVLDKNIQKDNPVPGFEKHWPELR